MASQRDRQRRLLADLRDLTDAPLSVVELFDGLHALLREPLGFDAGCWHGADPVTGLPVSAQAHGLDPALFEHAARLELWSDDVATFAAMRRDGLTAETLHRATQGVPDRSVRYREMHTAAGFGDELRLALDTRGGRWGCAALMRSRERGPYRAGELRLATVVSQRIAVALRDRHQPGPGPAGAAAVPAVLVLDRRGRLVTANPRAEELLVELSDSFADVPSGFRAVAAAARGGPAVSQARLRSPTGQWLVLHASVLAGQPAGQVSVVAVPASPEEVMPIALLAFGLTGREREVAFQVARGGSTKDIARVLSLTANTVQDHLKSIFTKTGVSSRRELVARVLARMAPG